MTRWWSSPRGRGLAAMLLAGFLASCGAAPGETADSQTPKPPREFAIRYDLTLVPDEGLAELAMTLGEGSHRLAWVRFDIDPERHFDFAGDGDLERADGRLTWTPPEGGGTLRWRARIDHRRGTRYDARMTEDWALFRGDDLVPPARVRHRKNAVSRSKLHVHLPEGWSFVAPYGRTGDGEYRVRNDQRAFDRPTGWMLAGRIGVRLDEIADVRVTVAAPTGQEVRRMDILAFLRWNLPALRDLLPDMPGRLLVVSARDEMWRGGLSGPRSLYVHADRPLISENGTSTLLHEIIHTALPLDSVAEADWIVEGIAEFYSVELMRRTGTIGEDRFAAALAQLANWGREVESLLATRSRGAVTARAVGIFHCLDNEVRDRTDGAAGLDEVLRALLALDRKVDLDDLRAATREVAGDASSCLVDERLPGYPAAPVR